MFGVLHFLNIPHFLLSGFNSRSDVTPMCHYFTFLVGIMMAPLKTGLNIPVSENLKRHATARRGV